MRMTFRCGLGSIGAISLVLAGTASGQPRMPTAPPVVAPPVAPSPPTLFPAPPRVLPSSPPPAAATTPGKRPIDQLLRHVGNSAAGTAADLVQLQAHFDASGRHHTHIQQTVAGVPVVGGEAIVHLRSDGSPEEATDQLHRNVRLSTRPSKRDTEAIAAAEAAYGCTNCLTGGRTAELAILPEGESYRLVYKVSLRREDGTKDAALPIFFIDANTGAVVSRYDNLQTASGTSLYSGAVTFETYAKGAAGAQTFYLEDIGRKFGTYGVAPSTTNLWSAARDQPAIDVQFATGKMLDYLKTVHGRPGINVAGQAGSAKSADGATWLLASTVHVGQGNAYWNGWSLNYGDGSGTSSSPWVSLDNVGHEMTHALIDATARLAYFGESGALNESWADVFGAMLERFVRGESASTWRVCEDIWTPGTPGDALRYFDDPHAVTGSVTGNDPDHYAERYAGTGDNGGVHANSGIANKAFYLLAKGGTHHRGGTMTGIGADAAARIWYLALTSYMTSGTTFLGARSATLAAAAALFGATSAEATAVANAWSLVGVSESAIPSLVRNGTFELRPTPWVFEGPAAHWASSGRGGAGGTAYAYLGGDNSVAGVIYQEITIPPTATSANLVFSLGITSSEPTPNSADRLLVEVQDTAGNLLGSVAQFSNNGAGKTLHYVTRGPFSLLPYKGKSVRVAFRATTDATNVTTFRIDDVSMR